MPSHPDGTPGVPYQSATFPYAAPAGRALVGCGGDDMLGKLMRTVRAAVGPDGGPSDAELLRRFAASRDAGAFELLVWRHAGMVKAAAVAVLRDKHLAEDAAQAAFLALARRAGSVRDNPAGWLYRVARRVAVRHRRAAGVSRSGLVTAPPDRLTPAARPDADELAVLHDELARLPDRYRLPVLLCFLEGLSHADAAARLGWPVGTVAGRLSRAKDALRTRLARRGLDPALAGLAVAGDGPFAAATTKAAVAFAAGETVSVSPTVLPLVHGALRAMTLAKLKLVAGVVLACGTLSVGGVWAASQPPGAKAPATTATARVADPAQRQQSVTALKTLITAWYHHEGVSGWLPADSGTPTGSPLLSWRVHLLPSLGQDELYKRFKFDEPWDGPTNKPLLARMPAAFRSAFQPADAIDTYYQGFAGVGSAFQPGRKLRAADILDGTSNTLILAEVGPPVPWTRPADVPYDSRKPFPAVAWPFADVRHVAAGDGAIRSLAPTVLEKRWRKLIEIADGDRADPGFDGLTQSPAKQ